MLPAAMIVGSYVGVLVGVRVAVAVFVAEALALGVGVGLGVRDGVEVGVDGRNVGIIDVGESGNGYSNAPISQPVPCGRGIPR